MWHATETCWWSCPTQTTGAKTTASRSRRRAHYGGGMGADRRGWPTAWAKGTHSQWGIMLPGEMGAEQAMPPGRSSREDSGRSSGTSPSRG
eukprot:10905482-Heterocapsa_arctica.AAC.1